ncbi:ATG C terminal domain-domain-containing protein [Catenaria anguillulae PL171]|uniref:Autophagy-related protein 2 n=1 Tax=Catenaria anguillulae PL171 TaxID=765915 RepID=A0A1Y2HHY2_9FUNG|nr:ATG C terminal domain-domain-containing protein [Catenaria anguillulae PL171]
MWSAMAAPPGPVEWTWHLTVDGLSASVELSTSASTEASSAEFGSVPEVPIVALDVFDVHVEHSKWAPGHPGGVLDTLTVTVGTLEVRDLVPMSPWNKMVTAARSATAASSSVMAPLAGVAARSGVPAAGYGRATPGAGGIGKRAGGDAARVGVPSGTALPFARMDATCVVGPGPSSNGGDADADANANGGEWRAKVRVVPIKLHVFQETVDSVVHFASSVLSKIADDDEELVLIDPPLPSPMAAAATTPPVVSPTIRPQQARPPPFFQRVEVHPISLRIDYKPKSVDLPALQRGKVLELLNVFHLEGAEMTLRHVTVTGARGWDGLTDALVSYWVPHVRNTQLPGMVSGVGPLRSLVNIGTGVADLFLLPVEQYRRDGRLVKGLKKGAHSFVRTAAVETLSLGAKLAVGTHTFSSVQTRCGSGAGGGAGGSGSSSPIAIPGRSPDLLHARRRSSSTNPASPGSPSSHPLAGAGRMSSPSSPRPTTISKYANQPSNTREGLEQAMRTLSDNVTQAARVIAIPVEVMERDGATGTVRAVLRAVPIAVLKPMLGATDAVGKTLMGMRNGLDPERRREVRDKYKAASG